MDQDSIEKDRDALTALMLQLKQVQAEAGIIEVTGRPIVEIESVEIWDDIINEPLVYDDSDMAPNITAFVRMAMAAAPTLCGQTISVEDQTLSLLSNGNVDTMYSELECSHRILRAEHHLNQIRNLIAEKSFQFSHIVRISPRKSVTTRSRACVKKLNQQIAFHCRLYARC
jgi:hypothetical protein